MAGQEKERSDGQQAHEQEPVSRAVSKPALGAVPKGKRGAIYTINAQEGVNAAELVNVAFAKKTIGSATPRRLEVMAPDGPSTAGKKARQTIRLVPLTGDTGPVMCGFLDVTQKIVELRTFEVLTQQYEARFNARCDITAADYATLCRDLQMTLTPFRYTFTQEEERKADAAQKLREETLNQQGERSSARRFNIMMMVVFVAIAGAVALTFLR